MYVYILTSQLTANGERCTYSLLGVVRQLTAEEFTHSETHSRERLNKTLPGHLVIAQSGRPTYYTGKIIDVFLLPIVRKQNMYMGQPALHTTD